MWSLHPPPTPPCLVIALPFDVPATWRICGVWVRGLSLCLAHRDHNFPAQCERVWGGGELAGTQAAEMPGFLWFRAQSAPVCIELTPDSMWGFS